MKQKISLITMIAIVGALVLFVAISGGFFKNFSIQSGFSTVSYSANPWGTVSSISCSPNTYVANGVQVTLTATPSSGYAFKDWHETSPKDRYFYTNPLIFMASEDVVFEADMVPSSQQLTVSLTVDDSTPAVAQPVYFTVSTSPAAQGLAELSAIVNGQAVFTVSQTLASNGMALISQVPSQYSTLYGNSLSWRATVNGVTSNLVSTSITAGPTPTPTSSGNPPNGGKSIWQQIVDFFNGIIQGILNWFRSLGAPP